LFISGVLGLALSFFILFGGLMLDLRLIPFVIGVSFGDTDFLFTILYIFIALTATDVFDTASFGLVDLGLFLGVPTLGVTVLAITILGLLALGVLGFGDTFETEGSGEADFFLGVVDFGEDGLGLLVRDVKCFSSSVSSGTCF